ncbi:hypothetical protein B0H13DRAFT_1865121 [Mycena leptocephala]|nr:hypothetical protein B0H13DRAFT_1865121 [Mycena leptocephala]
MTGDGGDGGMRQETLGTSPVAKGGSNNGEKIWKNRGEVYTSPTIFLSSDSSSKWVRFQATRPKMSLKKIRENLALWSRVHIDRSDNQTSGRGSPEPDEEEGPSNADPNVPVSSGSHELLSAQDYDELLRSPANSRLPGFSDPHSSPPPLSSLVELLDENWIGESILDAPAHQLGAYRKNELTPKLKMLREELLSCLPQHLGFVCNKHGVHWAPCLVVMGDRIVLQGDSMGMDNDPEILLKLRWSLLTNAFMILMLGSNWSESPLPVPHQGAAIVSLSSIVLDRRLQISDSDSDFEPLPSSSPRKTYAPTVPRGEGGSPSKLPDAPLDPQRPQILIDFHSLEAAVHHVYVTSGRRQRVSVICKVSNLLNEARRTNRNALTGIGGDMVAVVQRLTDLKAADERWVSLAQRFSDMVINDIAMLRNMYAKQQTSMNEWALNLLFSVIPQHLDRVSLVTFPLGLFNSRGINSVHLWTNPFFDNGVDGNLVWLIVVQIQRSETSFPPFGCLTTAKNAVRAENGEGNDLNLLKFPDVTPNKAN